MKKLAVAILFATGFSPSLAQSKKKPAPPPPPPPKVEVAHYPPPPPPPPTIEKVEFSAPPPPPPVPPAPPVPPTTPDSVVSVHSVEAPTTAGVPGQTPPEPTVTVVHFDPLTIVKNGQRAKPVIKANKESQIKKKAATPTKKP